jgi:hypothetical protein
MALFPRKKTPLTPQQIAEELVAAYQRKVGDLPNRQEAELLYALMAHETGNGQSIVQHNWGNVMALGDQDYWEPPWAEDPDHPVADDPDAPQKFRAFKSHAEGADAWFKILNSPTHQRILEAAKRGDLGDFARGIATPHPVTKMQYCHDCPWPAIEKSYGSLANRARQLRLFEALKPLHSYGAVTAILLGTGLATWLITRG